MLVGPWLIVPLGLFGLAVGWWRVREFGMPAESAPSCSAYLAWVVFVPAYTATLVAFFVSSRYRLALLVPLVIGSGASATWLWDSAIRPERRRRLAPAVLAVTALAVALNWPIRVDDGRMFEREERIVRYITDGQFDEGRQLLAKTEPAHANRAL